MKAKKRLGQHFLEDEAVIQQIIQLIKAKCAHSLPLVEVGPGQGILTKDLFDSYDTFKAIEFDRDMISILKQDLPPKALIQADFLKLDIRELFGSEQYCLVGNFPYNISTQIVFKLIDNRDKIPVMVGMFQKEVAERICATPTGKKIGVISVRAQAHYTAEKVFDIPPTAFNPPPKVESSIIVLTRKKDYEIDCDYKLFTKIIKMSYGQRRKKLRNTLKSYLQDLDNPIFQKRPEELSVEEFVNITKMIENQNLK